MISVLSDLQKLAVSAERSVCFVGENTLCKHFAQLHALLIEAVDIPDKSLEHDLVLKMSQESAE